MITDFYIKQGDTLEPINVSLTDDAGNLTTRNLTGAAIEFHMRALDGTLLVAAGAASLVSNTDKTVVYQWIAGDTDVASPSLTRPHQAEFQVTYLDGNIETFPNASNINIHVFEQVA